MCNTEASGIVFAQRKRARKYLYFLRKKNKYVKSDLKQLLNFFLWSLKRQPICNELEVNTNIKLKIKLLSGGICWRITEMWWKFRECQRVRTRMNQPNIRTLSTVLLAAACGRKNTSCCCIVNTTKLLWKHSSPFIMGLITAVWLLTSRHRSGEDSSISFSTFLSTSSRPKYVSGSTATASSCSVWYWSSAWPKKARSVTGRIWQPSVWETNSIIQFVSLTQTWEDSFATRNAEN